MVELRKKFEADTETRFNFVWLVVAVMLPTGQIELITNAHRIPEKIDYYLASYDHEFKLKTNPNVRIVGFMLV